LGDVLGLKTILKQNFIIVTKNPEKDTRFTFQINSAQQKEKDKNLQSPDVFPWP